MRRVLGRYQRGGREFDFLFFSPVCVYVRQYLTFFFFPYRTWTFWQYADSGVNPGDQDVFNGDTSSLQA